MATGPKRLSDATVKHLEPGDKVTYTITGTVASPPAFTNTNPNITILQVKRPPTKSHYATPGDGHYTEIALESPTVTVQAEVKSKYRNGVHVGPEGKYYMRRPDGWYPMHIDSIPLPPGTVVDAQRLKEAQDS